nr:hypothetical protein Iba_scaffold15441CG0040 [Ipomoea batatas]
MWNHTKRKISLILCQLYFAGIGMEANGVMFTSSSDLRDLYHHMILHTSTLMQMHIFYAVGEPPKSPREHLWCGFYMAS